MRLKSLHIKGFKSFANDTVIHFNDDVIGVVGPNGSGKSNVVDAIRWVLGEQKNSELRLESMTDVIFNGTRKRKEAASALVELNFENDRGILPSEYNQVAISRTLYRSGESEYRLNNVVCRLKDIKSLLVDTGIGSNSYAIIALGMVDDILEDKDDARRKMFEQASGISKYKNRKKETIQKLKNTSEDLNRVQDLLFEIEGNMKNLEKQAKKAKKFLELKQEYQDLAINSAVRSIQTLRDEYKIVNEKVTTKQLEYSTLNTEITTIEAQVEKSKKSLLEQELQLSAKQKQLGQLIANIRNAESEKSLTEQSRNFKVQNIKNLEKQIQLLEVEKITTDKEVESLTKSLTDSESELVGLQNSVNALKLKLDEIRLNYASLKKEQDDRLNSITRLQNVAYEYEKQKAVKQSQQENIQRESSHINQLIANQELSYDQIKSENEAIEAKLKVVSEQLSNQLALEDNRKASLTTELVAKDKMTEALMLVNRKIDSKQNEYDLLQSMVESYEGFPEAIKYLSNNWRKDVPILSDIIDVEEQYKGIIELYLEQYLNYFVVDNVASASQAITILGGAQKGKANFILLDSVVLETIDAVNIADAIPALSVVKVDKQYQALISKLLKNTYIFDGKLEDVPTQYADGDLVFLAKNGSYIKSRYTVAGGAIGLFEGKKIGRKKELEKMAKILKGLQEDKSLATASLEGVKNKIRQLEAEDSKTTIDKLKSEENTLRQVALKISIQTENHTKTLQLHQTKLADLSIQNEKLNTEISGLIDLISKTQAELELITKPSGKDSGSLDQISENMAAASEAYNNANIAFIKQQNLMLGIRKDLDYKENKLREIAQRSKQDQNKIKSENEEYLASSETLVKLDVQLKKLYSEKANYQGSLTDVEKSYHQSRNSIAEQEEKVKISNRTLNQLQVVINQTKERFSEIKYEISAVGDRLNIEFGVSANDVINAVPDTTMPLDEVLDKAAQLKYKISNFGEVNHLALEAYEEIKGRYEIILEQQADINEAKEILLNTIKEIEENATKQFLEAFEQIRTHFIEVFRSLFTDDDTCDLILVDPSDPLESHIEIIAKPKGKKPKSLSQLSGGEKTLTATALLFALYLIKPAPFCIFDEVDAPLDDANIQKFNKLIKRFSKDSQFIIVTHNKSTMTSVDVLYGVYMQEQGISAVTPVDFRNLDDDGRVISLT